MHAKQLIASVALFATAGSVFAQALDYEVPNANFVATKTRAEVVAEMKLGQATRPQAAPAVASGKTRAEVIAELQQAHAEGNFVVGGAEFVNDVPVMVKSVGSRAEVVESASAN